MGQAVKKKTPAHRSKVVKLPGKKKKIIDPIGGILEKEIESRGMTVAAWARHAKIPRSRVYKWFTGSAPKYDDRVKIDRWLNGGDANDLQKQIQFLQASNKALLNQVAKLMARATGQSITDAMASLKADSEIALNSGK